MIKNLFAKQSFKIFLLAIACFSFTGKSLFAQTDSVPANGQPTPQVVVTPPLAVAVLPVVSQVTSVTSSNPKEPNWVGLGEEIMVNVSNVEQFVTQAKQQDAKILLYVNDVPVKDVVSEHTPEGFRFFLENEGDVTALWDHMMASRAKNEFFMKKVSVTIGIEGNDPLPTKIDGKKNNYFTLILVNKIWFVMCIFLMLAMIGLFIFLAKKSDMLRDTGLPPATGRKSYSLARVQMGVWFLVVISSWLFLYVCLHRFNLLTDSILILMGITSATGLGGLAMDANKVQTIPSRSEGLWKDLVTDDNTVSLTRFQNLAWTVVLVIVFVRSVFTYLKMPEFDSTLLTLMGISSGTYIGGKVSEKNSAAATAAVNTIPTPPSPPLNTDGTGS